MGGRKGRTMEDICNTINNKNTFKQIKINKNSSGKAGLERRDRLPDGCLWQTLTWHRAC